MTKETQFVHSWQKHNSCIRGKNTIRAFVAKNTIRAFVAKKN